MIGPYELNSIVTGDARELAREIPDESVDLVICDPLYWEIADYRWLAQTAERILVTGGNVIAQAGTEYRFSAELPMRESGLDPRPLIAENYPAATGQMWKHKVFYGWKPHIWMSKGERKGGWIFDRVNGGGCDKSNHAWQDTPNLYLACIERLTKRDEVVLDPFCGGGTVPAVCKKLGRNYLAFEIDPEVAQKARERVVLTPDPLPFAPPMQQDEFVW